MYSIPLSALEAELQNLLGEEPDPDAAVPTVSEANAFPPIAPPPRVLVIDDNEDYRSLVRSLLKQRSCEVAETKDGLEGLRLARERQPDLLIVDFNMPGLNGYELIQEVRGLFELRDIPIIMFSGAANRGQLKEMCLDISDFLDKPVANGRLLAAVEKALGARAPRVPSREFPPAQEIPAERERFQEEVVEAAAPAAQDPLELIAAEKPAQDDGLELLQNDSPLISRINEILSRAVAMKASDVHIEPQETKISVRVRLDGSLKDFGSLPIALRARLAARIKIMSNLVITEHRIPQDGQFRARVEGQKIEFRVSTLPSVYGEKIVIRVLGQSKLHKDLAALETSSRDRACLERALKSPHGLILVTGPTGSGKTTTLYTMLSVLNIPDVNILTAEDPVEYRLPGITQVHRAQFHFTLPRNAEKEAPETKPSKAAAPRGASHGEAGGAQ